MKARFETASIADAVGKAARVAPTKGHAMENCAGIIFDFQASGDLVIMATNEKVYFSQILTPEEVDGEAIWRLSSLVINGILSKLPIGSGKEVTMECTDDREVHITSGRTKARIRTLDKTYYSFWNPFENAGLQLVENLGEKIKLVEWAADPKQNPPLAGVHITGTSVIATDRVRFASVPCDAPPITRPITIPLGVFDPLIKSMADCVIGISQGQLWLMPDEFTQIRAVIFADKYPNIERAMKRDHDFLVEFEKQDLIDMIERASVISTAAGDRIPLLKLFIGREEIAVMMEDQELGLLGDVIEVPGFANHNRIILGFAPENLLDPLRNSPGDKITLHYGESYKVPIRFVGGSGYEVWVAGRNV